MEPTEQQPKENKKGKERFLENHHHLKKEMVRLSSQYSNSMARILMDWDDFLKQNVSTYQTKPSGPEPG